MSIFLVSAIFILHLLVEVELLIVRRNFHDGILYEDYAADSDNIRYTTTSGEGWDDLDLLVEMHNLRDKAMFCTRGPGAWLLYQDANYQYGTMRMIKLVYGEHCVPADNVNSLQPLGAVYVNIEDTSAVVAFSEKYFASKGVSSRNNTSQVIKSAIFVGSGNWTVDIGGQKTCLIDSGYGDLCLLEDLQNAFSATSDQVEISKGCLSDEQYQLQNCFSKGFHELTYDFDFTVTSMKKICSEDYDPEDQAKDKFLTVINLWKKRIHPPTKDDIPGTVPNAAERVATLTEMIVIMEKTCSGVRPSFLEIVKQIYLMHIKYGLLWNVTVTPDGTRIEQSHAKWLRALSFIMDCANVNSEVVTGCYPEDISAMKDEKEIATIEDFLNGESYDFVIENVWLLLNYVSTYCNYHMGFKNNDWSIFPLLFKRDFLYPLQEQWKRPGKWSTFYPAMFHGYDMEAERKAMISCVQAVIKLTPFYDPLARPPGFYNGNSSADKDIVGGVVPPNNATNITNPDTRPKRQHDLYASGDGQNNFKAKVAPRTSIITTAAESSPGNSPSTYGVTQQTTGSQNGVPGQTDGVPMKRRVRRRRRRKGMPGMHVKKDLRKRILLENNMTQWDPAQTQWQPHPVI